MDVSNLITHTKNQDGANHAGDYSHQYPTRRSMSANESNVRGAITPTNTSYFPVDPGTPSPYNPQTQSPAPKHVAFELQLDGSSNYRARLPMRIRIFPHDTTESIVTTVKNFYGLYEGATKGVSFEDSAGNTLIARYENFQNNMTVYVRVIQDYSKQVDTHPQYPMATPQDSLRLGEVPQFLPPQPAQILHYGQLPSRPTSRASRKQSTSPKMGKGPSKHRSRTGVKSTGSSFQRQLDEINSDTINGSDSDGGAGSVTSSRKARSEQLATAEISVDNILAGNRRKRAKFESSVGDQAHRVLALWYETKWIFNIGTSPLRTTTSASTQLHLLCIPSKTLQWFGKPVAFCKTHTTRFGIWPSNAVASDLWKHGSCNGEQHAAQLALCHTLCQPPRPWPS